MHYDEDEVLTDYVWGNYHHLMTAAEKSWAKAARGRAKGYAIDNPFLRKKLENLVGDCSVQSSHLYCRTIRDRLLREHAAEIAIMRCSNCHRIVRTPRAQQCLWCGNNWHTLDPNT